MVGAETIQGAGVYQIRDIVNGYFYIGSSVDFLKRAKNHLYHLRRGTHTNAPLQRIFRKRPDCLSISVLELIEAPTRDRLISAEQKWLDQSAADPRRLNVLALAGSHLGAKRSPETCEKLSKASTGRTMSVQTRALMRAAKLGKKQRAEVVARLAERMKGRPGPIQTPEYIASVRLYSADQVAILRTLVAQNKPLVEAARVAGIARPTARRIIKGESYGDV